MGAQIAGSTLAFAQTTLSGDDAIHAGPQWWRRELSRLRACGFTAVDFVDSWFTLDTLDDIQLAALAGAIAAAELELVGVSVVRQSVIDPRDGITNLQRILLAVDATAKLGATLLSIGLHRPLTATQRQGTFWMHPAPTDDQSDATWTLAAERIREIADRCAARGLALSLELHEGTLLSDGNGAIRLLDEIGRENVGVNPDIGNLIRTPEPLREDSLETIATCSGRINYWHLKNYMRLEQPQDGLALSVPCALGEGTINYRRAIELARTGGYAGPYCIEHYGGDPLWAMARGREYLEQILQETP